jgi:hypothetical protein
MSWQMNHTDSEHLASLAELASRQNDTARAVDLYGQAAEAELRALADVDPSKTRTLGITAVSAASLFFKALRFHEAQATAHRWLASDRIPDFAVDQLRTLLQLIWSEEARQKSGLQFMKGQVLFSVRGGEVVYGGAPLELIVTKVDEVARLVFRTIEMLLNKPLRKRGLPEPEIRDQLRPWLFQVPAGSYQFAVQVERPRQIAMFPGIQPEVEEVTQRFLDIVRAGVEDPEGGLAKLVPNDEYRETFLKLTRNLAPTGKAFERLEIRSAGTWDSPIVLEPSARESISATLREARHRREPIEKEEVTEQLKGTLRGLQLDNDWLEVGVPGEDKPIHVVQAGDAIDDVIGPMVNHRVIVEVAKKGRRYYFRDIQLEE